MKEMHSLTWPGPKGTGAGSWKQLGHLECAHGEVRARRVLGAEPLPAGLDTSQPGRRLLSSLLNYPSLSVSHAGAQFHSAKCSKKTAHR